jgi:ATP-dependent DNA helicase PIF1
MICTGAGGTGKTYLIRGLKQLYANKLMCTAPTGAAAFKIPDGRTLHNFLKLPIGWIQEGPLSLENI